MGVIGAALKPRIDIDMETKAVEPRLFGYAKQSSVKPLDPVLEALL